MKVLIVLAVFIAAAAAVRKCCPQPESEGKCGCCPDACCCICSNTTIPGSTSPPRTTGPPITTTTSTVCELFGLDVVIVIDSSSSVDPDEWDIVTDFLGNFTTSDIWNEVGVETRFAFVVYSSAAEIVWDLTSSNTDSPENLIAAFKAVPKISGFTNTSGGIAEAINIVTSPALGDRNDTLYPDVILVFSDGKANIDLASLPETSAEARSESSLLFAIGITDNINETEMAVDIAANPANFMKLDDFANLISDFEMIIETLLVQLCESIFPPPPTTTTPPPTTTIAPQVVETCKCCCPPLPDPCMPKPYGSGDTDPCCCRFDQGSGKKRRR